MGKFAKSLQGVKLMPAPNMTPFEDRYVPEPMSGCWIWMGSLMAQGYGYAGNKSNGQPLSAHRRSWELHRGPIPKGKHVLHKCDIRCCVYPDHLYVGTHQDNMRDMHERGRHGMAKLTKADIPHIRSLLERGYKAKDIAYAWGVDRSAISHIKRGATWRNA